MRIQLIVDVDDSLDPSELETAELWTREIPGIIGGKRRMIFSGRIISAHRLASREEVSSLARRILDWMKRNPAHGVW